VADLIASILDSTKAETTSFENLFLASTQEDSTSASPNIGVSELRKQKYDFAPTAWLHASRQRRAPA